MSKMAPGFRSLLRPSANTNPWPDVVVLLVFGTWLFTPLFIWLFGNRELDKYPCSGPGFADFGCVGGWEAVVSSVISIIFVLFTLSVILVALNRLLYRMKK